ncbi:MAG: DUF4190 domain-containing protein [Gaiellales bacterium]
MDNAMRQEVSGKAVASLALGVISFFALPFIGGVLALILGWMAKTEIREHPAVTGEGYATAGIILGVVNVLGSLLMFFLFFTATAVTVNVGG